MTEKVSKPSGSKVAGGLVCVAGFGLIFWAVTNLPPSGASVFVLAGLGCVLMGLTIIGSRSKT